MNPSCFIPQRKAANDTIQNNAIPPTSVSNYWNCSDVNTVLSDPFFIYTENPYLKSGNSSTSNQGSSTINNHEARGNHPSSGPDNDRSGGHQPSDTGDIPTPSSCSFYDPLRRKWESIPPNKLY